MDKKFTWTIDCEGDFGGRTNGTEGIDRGLPKILKAFKEHNVKGLFFISTETLENRESYVMDILNQGHEIGSHGHFHICYKEPWRVIQDKTISDTILKGYKNESRFEFRAPKFHYKLYGHVYSDKINHVSVMKRMWYGQKIPKDPIFYLHPFDIVGGGSAPNLFSKIWYSHPKDAYETFLNLLRCYPGSVLLDKISD